jgi:iron complex outermembrane receptor protein/hemoglobin/transferrin/lactoferrin receptor protein
MPATRAFALALLVVSSATSVRAQNARPAGDARAAITGTIVDERARPVARVLVTVPSLLRSVTSNDSGYFELRDLPATSLVLVARRLGYQSERRQVDLGPAARVALTLTMARAAVTVEEVVVTGRATASERRGAQDVAALGEAQLRESATGSIGKTLEKVPGVSNMSGGPAAGNPVLRGLSQGRVRIVKDGVPQESFEASPRWFPPGNLASTDRIEVIRGPASILYGSSAIGGAINIIPRALPSSGGGDSRLYGLIESQYFNNNGEKYVHGEMAGAAGAFGLRAGGASRVAGNFRTADAAMYADSKVQGDPKVTGSVNFSNYEQTSRYAQAGVAGAWGQVRVLYDGWDGSNNFPNANGKPTGVHSTSDDVRMQSVIIGQTFVWKPSVVAQRVHIQRAATIAKTFEVAADSNLWDQDLINNVVTGRLEVSHSALKGFAGTVGTEYTHQEATTKLSQIQPSGTVGNVAAFALEEYRIDRLTLSAGGRADARSQKAASNSLVNALPAAQRDAALDRTFNVVTGSLGAAYQWTDPLSVVVNVSRGFRAPSFLDLYTNENRPVLSGWVEGNPNARPERATSVEAGLHYDARRLALGLVGYRNVFSDFTYLSKSTRTHLLNGVALPIFATNQTAARLAGVEATVSAELVRSLALDASYAQIVSKNISTTEELPLMPADQLRVGVRYAPASFGFIELPTLHAGMKHAWFKRVAGVTEPFADGGTQGFGVASTPAYTIADVSASGRVTVGTSAVDLNLSVENLFGTAYRDFLDTQKGFTLGAGRNIALRVAVPLVLRR